MSLEDFEIRDFWDDEDWLEIATKKMRLESLMTLSQQNVELQLAHLALREEQEKRRRAYERAQRMINKELSDDDDFSIERPTRPLLDDLILPQSTRDALEEAKMAMLRPGVFNITGTNPPKSYLLYGPPGTGKTMSTNALANQIAKEGRRIHVHEFSIGTRGSIYVDGQAKGVEEYFQEGLRSLNQGNIVLYLVDEAESVLMSRTTNSDRKHHNDRVNQFNMHLQRINNGNGLEYVFFMTNFPEALDDAAVRSGRVDRLIPYLLPEHEQLTQAYAHYFGAANGRAAYKVIEADPFRAARESKGFNYADVSAVVNACLQETAMANARKEDLSELEVVDDNTLLYHVGELRKKKQPETGRKAGF